MLGKEDIPMTKSNKIMTNDTYSDKVLRKAIDYMNKDKNLNVPDEFKNIYKVLNKLEQRISTLEKVLASHAKCIGEMREEKKDDL